MRSTTIEFSNQCTFFEKAVEIAGADLRPLPKTFFFGENKLQYKYFGRKIPSIWLHHENRAYKFPIHSGR